VTYGPIVGGRDVSLQGSGGVHIILYCIYVYTGLMVNNQAGRAEETTRKIRRNSVCHRREWIDRDNLKTRGRVAATVVFARIVCLTLEKGLRVYGWWVCVCV